MADLVDACPSFQPRWGAYLEEHAGEECLDFVEGGALAYHLVRLARDADTHEFDGLFSVVEELLSPGDAELHEWPVTGLVEDIQRAARDERVDLGLS